MTLSLSCLVTLSLVTETSFRVGTSQESYHNHKKIPPFFAIVSLGV